MSLGGETISGEVCSLTQAFSVNVNSPHVPFVFGFVPQSGTHGAWTYAYSIPSAGEAHDASGKYTVGSATDHGTLALTMTGKDHVVFKGFDGMMPVSYSFKLVPSSSTSCP